MFLIMRKIISRMVYYSGLTLLFRMVNCRKTMILAYHRVDDTSCMFDQSLVSASITGFNQQMDYISKNYNVISLERFVDLCNNKKRVPMNSLIITFDDGYRDNFMNAFPILKKCNFPATVFLTTGMIGKIELPWWENVAYVVNNSSSKTILVEGIGSFSLEDKAKATANITSRLKDISEKAKNSVVNNLLADSGLIFPNRSLYLNWYEVKKMLSQKISFGAHTENHPILTKIPLAEAKQEIRNSKLIIEKKTGKKIILFSYPNGKVYDFDSKTISLLKDEGFKCAVTYIPGWNTIRSNLFKLKRVSVRRDDDIIMFKNKLAGFDNLSYRLYSFLSRTLRRAR